MAIQPHLPPANDALVNTYNTFSDTQKSEFWDSMFLKLHVQYNFSHEKFAEVKRNFTNAGTTIRFPMYDMLSKSINKLGDNTLTPDPLTGSTSFIDVTAKNYGNWILFNDHFEVLHQFSFDLKAKYMMDLMRLMMEERDDITKEVMLEESSKYYAGGVVTDIADVTDGFDLSELIAIRLGMIYNNEVREVQDSDENGNITSQFRIHRKPINAPGGSKNFPVLIGEVTKQEILNDEKFQNLITSHITNTYFLTNTLPTILGLTFVEIENEILLNNATGPVFVAYVLGEQAYGCVSIDGSYKFLVTNNTNATTDDPLNRVIATAGYKYWYGARVLNPLAITAYLYQPQAYAINSGDGPTGQFNRSTLKITGGVNKTISIQFLFRPTNAASISEVKAVWGTQEDIIEVGPKARNYDVNLSSISAGIEDLQLLCSYTKSDGTVVTDKLLDSIADVELV